MPILVQIFSRFLTTGGGGYKVSNKTTTWPYNHPLAGDFKNYVTL